MFWERQMRLKSALLALLLVAPGLQAGPALADPNVFEGAWAGKGTLILRGDITQCSSVEFYFSVTADTFTFNGGQRTCDKQENTFKPEIMTFRDGVLYYRGEVAGTSRDDLMEAHFQMPGNTTWRMSMRREGDNLVYEDSLSVAGETTPMISFAAMLKRASPPQTVTKAP
jgi:hypothetical protein